MPDSASSSRHADSVDCVVLVTPQFVGTMALGPPGCAVVTQWLAKSVCGAAVTPVTCGAVNLVKRQRALDVYDRETRFNRLLVTE